MHKLLSITTAVILAAGSAWAQVIVVDFDTAANWTAGSGALSSYQTDHVYSQSGLVFTGGDALRETAGIQDGYFRTFGNSTYAWRLRDVPATASVTWTATYTVALGPSQYISGFGFAARRWDGSPSPNYFVHYSVDGGLNWTLATSIGSSGVLDNAAFGNSSDWSAFSQSLTSPTGLGANQFVVRLSQSSTGERIMVDNFRMEIIPEPATIGLVAGFGGLLLIRRRFRR